MATSNIFVTLDFPASGTGAASSVSSMAAEKTFVVSGSFAGDVIIEGSQDGTNFLPVTQAEPPAGQSKQISIVAVVTHLRLRRLGSGDPGVVTVGSTTTIENRFSDLTLIVPGPGPIVDTAAFGPIKTYMATGNFAGQIVFEGSQDDANFDVITELNAGQYITISGSYKSIRVRTVGFVGTATVTLGSGQADGASVDSVFTPIWEDDFAGGGVGAEVGNLGWNASNATFTAEGADTNHPGIAHLSVGSGLVGTMTLVNNATSRFLMGEWDTFTWIIQPGATTSTPFRVGLADTFGGTPTDGVYLEHGAAETNWFVVTMSGGVPTRIDSGVPFDSIWVKVEVVNLPGSIAWKVNGNVLVSIATIPTPDIALQPGGQLAPVGATRFLLIDYFRLTFKPLDR